MNRYLYGASSPAIQRDTSGYGIDDLAFNDGPTPTQSGGTQGAEGVADQPGVLMVMVGGGSESSAVHQPDRHGFDMAQRTIGYAWAKGSGARVDVIDHYPSLTGYDSVATIVGDVEPRLLSQEMTLVIVGYSRGGDIAVDVSQALETTGIHVDMLVTIDPTVGPLSPLFMDTEVPSNVSVAANFYQIRDWGDYAGIPDDGIWDDSLDNKANTPISTVGAGHLLQPASGSGTWVYNVEVPNTDHNTIFDKAIGEYTSAIGSYVRHGTPDIALYGGSRLESVGHGQLMGGRLMSEARLKELGTLPSQRGLLGRMPVRMHNAMKGGL